jgi:hypothetical protein
MIGPILGTSAENTGLLRRVPSKKIIHTYFHTYITIYIFNNRLQGHMSQQIDRFRAKCVAQK